MYIKKMHLDIFFLTKATLYKNNCKVPNYPLKSVKISFISSSQMLSLQKILFVFMVQKNAKTAFSASPRKRGVPYIFLTFLIKMRLVRIIITLATFLLTLKGNLLAFHPHPETFGPFPAMSGSSTPVLSLFPRWILSLPSPEELSWLLYDLEERLPYSSASFLPHFFSFFFLMQKSFLPDLRK